MQSTARRKWSQNCVMQCTKAQHAGEEREEGLGKGRCGRKRASLEKSPDPRTVLLQSGSEGVTHLCG